MTTREDQWRRRISRLTETSVQAAVVVQCGIDWLRPHRLALRNDTDEALLRAQLRRGGSLRITRLVLHNLPVSVSEDPDFDAVTAAFDEWQYRLAAACSLLSPPAPRVHRLIINGDQPTAPPADRLELLENGRWTDAAQAETILRLAGTGSTTPLTGYDVGLTGPFSDDDPSVHM
ncbi:hypothetical protein ACWCXE_03500 [Streptomyces sp. NPDC001780]